MTGVSAHYDRQGEPRAGGVRFRDTDPRPPATSPDELRARDASGYFTHRAPVTTEERAAYRRPPTPAEHPVGSRPRDLAHEIETGDFEDRSWMIDALERAAVMLRRLDP